MESARPYYSNSWPPILYAATLWLNVKGFELNETPDLSTKSSDGTNNNHSPKTDSNRDRFHLLFGELKKIFNAAQIQWIYVFNISFYNYVR